MFNKKVCIVGGGNAGHVLAAWLPSRGIETYWYVQVPHEFDKIDEGLKEQGHIEVMFDTGAQPQIDLPETPLGIHVRGEPGKMPHGKLCGKPKIISSDPKDVIPHADILFCPVPSFAYEPVLETIRPHLKQGQIIIFTPGQGGCNWIARKVLGEETYNKVNIIALLPMLLNCRIIDFGKSVRATVLKKTFKFGACIANDSGDINAKKLDLCHTIRDFLDAEYVECIGSGVSISLLPINSVIHTSRDMYINGINYKVGDILQVSPPFYEGMDDESIDLMQKMGCEYANVTTALNGYTAKTDNPTNQSPFTLEDTLRFCYGNKAEWKDVATLFRENTIYKGYPAPLTAVTGGFVPDFTHRYYTEDIPFGLCFIKGVATILKVKTPVIDSVINWTQRFMGKEYIVDGEITGADVKETSAPQNFGIHTVEGLIA